MFDKNILMGDDSGVKEFEIKKIGSGPLKDFYQGQICLGDFGCSDIYGYKKEMDPNTAKILKEGSLAGLMPIDKNNNFLFALGDSEADALKNLKKLKSNPKHARDYMYYDHKYGQDEKEKQKKEDDPDYPEPSDLQKLGVSAPADWCPKMEPCIPDTLCQGCPGAKAKKNGVEAKKNGKKNGVEEEKEDNKLMIGLIIGGVVFVLLIIAVVIFFMMRRRQPSLF